MMERALRGDSALSLAEFCRWSGDPFLELLATTHEGWGRYQVQRAEASHGPLIAAYLARSLPPITWTFTSPWDGRSISIAQDPEQVTKSREMAEIHRHLDDPQCTLWLLLRDGEEVHGLALVRHEGTGIPPALLHLEASTEDPIALVYLVQKALSPLAEQGAMVIHRPSPPLLHLLRRCGIEPLHERALIQWSEVFRRFLSGEGGPNSEGEVPPSPHSLKKFPPGWEVLSAREKEVALLVAEGLSNEEVAAKLFVTEATVKKHLTAVYDKLGIRSRSQLILALAPVASTPEKEA
ncbi:MAG: hypothetical protein KM310_05790 [Clostridiales bacterium]|nr:hypothetical protein [Clostridiales bacterium]